METPLGFPNPQDAHAELGVQLLGSSELFDGSSALGRPFQEPMPTVGRREELAALVDFASARGPLRVAVIPGRAGMGKTSVLAALSDALAAQRVGTMLRFATDVTASGTPSAPRLPPGPCLVVIDDACRKAATATLLYLAARERRDVRFVLTTRPAGIPRLEALFAQVGLSTDAVRTLPELGPLAPNEAESAAAQALGEEQKSFADKLAAAAEGHPFVIALAGRLLAEGALHPVALERTAVPFAARALERAYEMLLLRAAASVDQKLVAGVLALIAALAPVRTSDERFLQNAGELLGCRRRELVSALRALEAAGVLDRSPHGVRVAPGALSDHVLHRALSGRPEAPSLDRAAPFGLVDDGATLGQAELRPKPRTIEEIARQLEERFGTQALVPLLRNAGELDGQPFFQGASDKPSTELVASLFRHAQGMLEAASSAERCRLLSALRDLATDHPEPMLELVSLAMRLPARAEAQSASGLLASPSSVLYELPSILRRIGLHLRHLPRVVDRLWELGCDDLRLQSPHPDHPMRVLRELASRANARPVGVHEALLDGVDRWLTDPSAHEHKHSPLDVIETFLADVSTESGPSDDRLHALRAQALAALSRCACATNRRAALSGVSGLERVLGDGSLEGRAEPSFRDGERLRILAMLRDAALDSKDALVHFAVADALRRAARRASAFEVRLAAEEAAAAVPTSAERRLYEALTQRSPSQRVVIDLPASEAAPAETERGSMRPPRGDGDAGRSADVCRAVVDEQIASGATPEEMARDLGAALDALSLAGKSGSPRLLLHVLSRKHPDVARATCEAIMRAPDGPLGPHVASLLHALRESSPEQASELVLSIVGSGDPTLCASIAQVFHRWVEKPLPGDREALRKLLLHRDGFVRRAALGALRTLAKSSPRDALDLAVGIDLSEGPEVAEALFGALDAGGLFTERTLSEEELILFLSRLGTARSLDGHSTMRFLHHAGKRLPEEVALLMIDRITQAAGGSAGATEAYEPLPPEGLGAILSGLPRSPEWLPILRRVRHLARARTGWVRFHAARLFHDASNAFAPPSVEVLSEWVQSGGAEELEAISALLEEAPASFLFAHLDLVATLLRRAQAASEACFERVRSALFSVATGQARPRSGRAELGESELRAAAREAALRLPPRSPEQRFFDAVGKHADALLAEEEAAEDDELFDL